METRLEETQLEDVLMPPEEVSSLTLDGYVAHPLFTLVLLVEYTVRWPVKCFFRGVYDPELEVH